ncbi:MAG: hypothetical protein ABR514_01495 [Chthoniobacterales bacterium]
MKKAVIVYWLIPARPERELFRVLINILGKQFKAPTFEPHLTLCFAKDRQSPAKLLRQLKASPVRVEVREVDWSAKFTKTLFVRMKPNPTLERLAAALNSIALKDPHISLLYKKLPARIKQELAAAIKLPLRNIAFDSIKAVRCTSPMTTAAEVQSWRVIATRRLLG